VKAPLPDTDKHAEALALVAYLGQGGSPERDVILRLEECIEDLAAWAKRRQDALDEMAEVVIEVQEALATLDLSLVANHF
jgi:hypothetical protein